MNRLGLWGLLCATLLGVSGAGIGTWTGSGTGQRLRISLNPCVCVPLAFPGRGTVRPLRAVPSAQPLPSGEPRGCARAV